MLFSHSSTQWLGDAGCSLIRLHDGLVMQAMIWLHVVWFIAIWFDTSYVKLRWPHIHIQAPNLSTKYSQFKQTRYIPQLPVSGNLLIFITQLYSSEYFSWGFMYRLNLTCFIYICNASFNVNGEISILMIYKVPILFCSCSEKWLDLRAKNGCQKMFTSSLSCVTDYCTYIHTYICDMIHQWRCPTLK